MSKIFLSSTSKLLKLKGVSVTLNTSVIQNKIDKIANNVENDLTLQGGVASAILKKVPD